MKQYNRFNGWKILKLLGVNTKDAFEANICIKTRDVLTVEVKYYVRIDGKYIVNEDETDIKTEPRRYKLTEIKEDEAVNSDLVIDRNPVMLRENKSKS